MMKLHFEKRVRLGLVLMALVLLILGVFSFTSTQRLINTARLLSHATRIINNAEQVIKGIIDVETGQRGYVITGDTAFLEPFNKSPAILQSHLKILDSLTVNHQLQHDRVAELQEVITDYLIWSQKVVDARTHSYETAHELVASGVGKEQVDKARTLVIAIQNEEREIFRRSNTISSQNLQEFQYSFLGLAISITAIISYLFYLINKTFRARGEVEEKLRTVASECLDLYDNAPCGYFSVDSNIMLSNINQRLLRWLRYTRDEVVGKMKFEDLLAPESKAAFLFSFEQDFEKYKADGFATDLDFDFLRKDGTTLPVVVSSVLVFNDHGEFAGSRTTVADNTERKKAADKIKLLNQELESFTYSVSHDLRAPLRAVTGYAQILIEEYGDKLDAEGKRIIDIVTGNANRMGQLIDDLLEFSRLGRKELSQATLHMEKLVQGVVQELRVLEKNRQLNVRILPLYPSKGDHNMIRQVWINLISNAIKYSSKKETTEIEIGSYDKNTQTCYYIRDNGTGFDMLYVDKLFGVFQRLHKMSEFEGTGVGLAVVKMIVKRHGGTVWAEGKVNKGATFYFTLPTVEHVEP